NLTSGAFKCTLRPLQHHHVVGLASRLEDASHLADKEHVPYGFGVLCILCSKIAREQARKPRRSVPTQAIKVVTHGMKAALLRSHIDRLVNHIFRDSFESEVL